MNFRFQEYQIQLIESGILLLILFFLRQLLKRAVSDFTRRIERLEHRTALVMKHVNITVFAIGFLGLILIWGVDFRNIGLVFSSIFAMIGVAFFAQWSILSNITSGLIMFFTFPYRIGDYIKIHDKDFPTEGIIEDIKTFHVILLTNANELVTYPNSMMLQKGVSILNRGESEAVPPTKSELEKFEKDNQKPEDLI